MGVLRLCSLFLAAAAWCFCLAAVASAETIIGSSGPSGFWNGPLLAAGPGSGLAVAWTTADRSEFKTSEVVLSAGSPMEGFSAPRVLSEAGDYAQLEDLVSDASGAGLAVWHSWRAYDQERVLTEKYVAGRLNPFELERGFWYSFRRAGGAFSSPLPVAAPMSGRNGSTQLAHALAAMNVHGESVIAYSARGSIYVRRGTASGTFGKPVRVVARARAFEDYLLYAGLDDGGEAMVVWEVRPTQQASGAVQVSVGRLGHPFGTPQTVFSPSPRVGYTLNKVAAMGASGAAVVAYHSDSPQGQCHGSCTRVVYRRASGRFGAPQTIEGVWPFAVNVDRRAGVQLILARESSRADVFEVARSGPSGVLAAPVVVGLIGEPLRVSVAGDSDGDLAISNSNWLEPVMQLRTSLAGGSFGAPVTLASNCCSLNNFWPIKAGVPAVAVTDESEVASAWVGPESETSLLLSERTPTGPSPVSRIELVEPPVGPSPYAPASVLDLGEAAHPDRTDRLHGSLTCGNNPPSPCKVDITVKATAFPHRLLAARYVQVPAMDTRNISVTLDSVARRLLAQRVRIRARVMVTTQNDSGPATVTDYPLLIIR